MRKRGFTLVEIMIVVAIVALLAAIAIPNLLRMRVNANETNAQAVLKTISTAQEAFAAANNGSYTNIAALAAAVPAYVNQNYTLAAQQGYNIAEVAGAAGGYAYSARPANQGVTGVRGFCIRTGAIFLTPTADGSVPGGCAA